METITLKLKSTAPMLMHSDRFANPLDPATKAHKELTSKRKKTDEDHEAIAVSEFNGSLYIDPDGPFIPSMNLEAAFVEAAKMQKLGKHAKRALMILEDKIHLQYERPARRGGACERPPLRRYARRSCQHGKAHALPPEVQRLERLLHAGFQPRADQPERLRGR